MKRFLFLLLIPLSTFGQDYLPFPLENAKWTNGYYSLNTDNPNFYFLELIATEVFEPSNDTLINGVAYTQIISNDIDEPYNGALRNAEGQVLMVFPDSVNELVLYDFTLTPGDSIFVYDVPFGTTQQVVNDTYQIDIEGVSRKVIEFHTGYKWIEGIGAESGLFMAVISNISGGGSYLECFELDGDQIFSSDQAQQGCLLSASNGSSNADIVIFPNPSSGKFDLQGIEGIITYQLIEPTGRIVKAGSSSPSLNFNDEAKGIYLLRIKSSHGWSAHRLILK